MRRNIDGFFSGGTEINRGNVRISKLIRQVRGGRDGKRTDIFMFKKKLGREKKTQNNKTKQNSRQRKKRVSYNTVLKK